MSMRRRGFDDSVRGEGPTRDMTLLLVFLSPVTVGRIDKFAALAKSTDTIDWLAPRVRHAVNKETPTTSTRRA